MTRAKRYFLSTSIIFVAAFWIWLLWPSRHYGRFPLFDSSSPQEVALNRVSRATQLYFARYDQMPTTLDSLVGTAVGTANGEVFSRSDVAALRSIVYMPSVRQAPVSLQDRIIAYERRTNAEVLVVRFNGRVLTMRWDELEREIVVGENPNISEPR